MSNENLHSGLIAPSWDLWQRPGVEHRRRLGHIRRIGHIRPRRGRRGDKKTRSHRTDKTYKRRGKREKGRRWQGRINSLGKYNSTLATPQFLAMGKESRYSRPFQAQARRGLYSSAQGHSSFIGPGGMPRSQARREIQGKSPAAARRIGTSASFCGKKANPLSADPIPPMLMSITPFWPVRTKAFLKTGGWQVTQLD